MATEGQEDSSTSETPTKRIKTQNPAPENSPSPTLFSCKGKSKLELETNYCGICLSEAAQDDNCVSRGYINSCDHYFCFVCIMEWAKVESKCPLCKRRFSTIRRPAKPPVFPSDRLVRVPVRDQVCYYYGNATIAPLDPYSEVKCSVCESSVDESLLLLCDLCDSAAHTYCVGLGATVPEGDWFCHDCTLLRDERSKGEIDTDSKDQTNSANLDESRSENEHVSIFDIVRGPNVRLDERSSANYSSCHQGKNLKTSLEDDMTFLDSSRRTNIVQDATKLTGRTLRRCRNIHNRIQVLRDNWNSFRRGSLSFSSSKSNYECIADSKPKIGYSVQSSSTSCSSLKLNVDNGSPGTSHNRGSCEIDKAWKMLDMAKSIEKRKSTVCQASKYLSSKHVSSNSQNMGSQNLAVIKQEQNYDCPVGKDGNKHKTLMLERQNHPNQKFGNGGRGFGILSSPLYCQLISSRDVQCPIGHDVGYGNVRNRSEKTSLGSPSTVSDDCSRPICTSTSTESEPAAANSVCQETELHAPSSCKKESSIEKGSQKNPVGPKAKGNNDAKSEIQSLVKLNIKLLSQKKLEVDVFKEVARLATHSILGACGIEHPKPAIHSFPSSICCHEKDSQQFRRSTLMPNSCRECFYVFVKNVVNTIMNEKIGCRDVS